MYRFSASIQRIQRIHWKTNGSFKNGSTRYIHWMSSSAADPLTWHVWCSCGTIGSTGSIGSIGFKRSTESIRSLGFIYWIRWIQWIDRIHWICSWCNRFKQQHIISEGETKWFSSSNSWTLWIFFARSTHLICTLNSWSINKPHKAF